MSTELRPGDQAGGIGDSIDRREDSELLTGRGTFVDDIEKRGMLHMAIHRSQYAHAEIKEIDTSAAEAMDGVVAAFTAADMEAAGVPGHVPPVYRVHDMVEPDHPILARDRVRHQGKPVAVVVAEDRYLAHRAADAIEVDYDRLEAVVNPLAALEDDAPQLHEGAPNNLSFEYEDGDAEAAAEALDGADNFVDFSYTYQRLAPNAIEPRGMVAEYDPTTNDVTVEMPTQNPFLHQTILADVLNHPQNRIRIKSPRIGGSFASKSMVHPEECLTAFSALQLQRPVKYICTRSESFQSDEHGRSMEIEGAIGVDDDGTIVGARIQATCGLGATMSTKGTTGPTAVFGPMISGAYKIPALHYKGLGVFTNATPASAYRGVGRAPASFTVERLVTLAAREIGLDPAEIRRKNFIQEDEFPYETPVLTVYDSGTYEQALDMAMDMVDYDDLREEQANRRAELVGYGDLELTDIGGIGPKTAVRLSETLGVDSVADLRAAAEAGRLSEVEGIGSATAAAIADSLESAGGEPSTNGRYLGIGLSSFVEPGGFAPTFYSEGLRMTEEDSAVKASFWESGSVRFHDNGQVTVNVGTASPGTGTETAMAQIAVDILGVDHDDVTVIEGKDTRTSPQGQGTSGSRNAVMGGNAVRGSAEKVIEKARKIAAHKLEADEDDIEFENGEFAVKGAPDRSLSIKETAEQAYLGHDLPEGMEPSLEAQSGYNPPNLTFAHGTHIVVVEVDPESGEVDLRRYCGVDDCGVRINPKIVEGQEHGGAAAGLSAALYEGIEYDDNGNLLTASYQDYALIRAPDMPELELEHTETPSPSNPMGVKGKGESGAISTPQAVVNAVTDALQPFGVDNIEMPITNERVWNAVNGSGKGS